MTDSKFILKAIRKAERNRAYNRSIKSATKTAMSKPLEKLSSLTSADIDVVQVQINEAYSVIDKAVKRGVFHKNTGARKKSRLSSAFKKAVEAL